MFSKKKKKNQDTKKYTITSNHTFSKNISRVLDELGKTSKNTFNHYLFCYKFYTIYKDIINEQVYYEVIKNNLISKDHIDKLFHSKIKEYYNNYKLDYKSYISNNNILYNYIKKLNLNITNINFVELYNKLILECITLDKLNLNNKNLIFLYEKNIYSILISFYYYKYYNVKNGLINKIPIKFLIDENFKNYVMTTDKPENFINNINYKELLNSMLNIERNKYISKLKNTVNKNELEELNKLYKLGSEQNFLGVLVYSTIEFNKTSSDIISNTINKSHAMISSYYELKKLGIKASKPKFIKDDFYSIIFCGKTIKHEDKNISKKQVRLLYGDFITNNWKKIFNEELTNKLIFKIKKPKILNKNNVQLKQIEIKKISNRTYKIFYKLDAPNKNNNFDYDKVKLSETISIDLGIKNLLTIHDPYGKQKILKGGYLISTNEYYNKKISIVQSKRDISKNKKEKLQYDNEIQILNDMRLRKLNGKINLIIQKIKELYSDKKLIVIGYNEGWKDKMNLGRNTNRKFYQIPFSRIISKLRYALSETIEIIEINESYTSKCDSLGQEKICKHNNYLGKRTKRGLFSSSIHKLLNADLNGAINILRKYTDYKYNVPRGINLYNPEKITL